MPRAARARIRAGRLFRSLGFPKDWFLIPLAAVIGCLGGLVATGFDWLVEASGEFFFGHLGQQEFPLSEYLLLILLPAAGGLAVGLIQNFISRTGPTHGIPEVIESLAKRHGRMPARMGTFKVITASLTIGSGGSGGVEGPIIQTGSVLGSVVAQWLRVGREHMHTLVGCGAAAGMAGIFNAPIAGVMFVLEVLLRDFSVKTFIPIVVASVFGTAVAQAIGAENVAVFAVPEAMRAYQVEFAELWAYALLGVMCGLLGVVFSMALHLSERMWARVPGPPFMKPALGGAVLGVLGIVFVLGFGRPVVGFEPPTFFSNGYPVIEALLDPLSYVAAAPPVEAAAAEAPPLAAPWRPPLMAATVVLLMVSLLFKVVGTCITLGSGGSGGIIAPSLFLGATLGGTLGLVLEHLGIFPGYTPATYALAGMAGVIAATVHAPLTAFLLVFEMTQDYKVILPVMLVAILATMVSQLVSRDSIYTAWLRRHGIRVGSLSDMVLLRRLEVSHVPLTPAVIVHPEDPAQKLVQLAEEYAATDYVVVDDDQQAVGMVVGEDVRTTLVQREAIPLMIVGELMRTNLPTVTRDETLDLVLDKFSQHDVASLAVVDENQRVKGVITRSRLMRQYQRALEQA